MYYARVYCIYLHTCYLAMHDSDMYKIRLKLRLGLSNNNIIYVLAQCYSWHRQPGKKVTCMAKKNCTENDKTPDMMSRLKIAIHMTNYQEKKKTIHVKRK